MEGNYQTNLPFHFLDIFIMIRKKITVPYFQPIPSQTREEKGKGYGIEIRIHSMKFLSISF